MSQFKNISNHIDGKLVVSTINQIEQITKTDGPSVKMVYSSGVEHYTVNGHTFDVDQNKYLVVGNQNDVKLDIDCGHTVKGICIFPTNKIFEEVLYAKTFEDKVLLDRPFDSGNGELIPNYYSFKENKTGRFLRRMMPFMLNTEHGDLNFDEFYTELAECMVDDQLELDHRLDNISCNKKKTKIELYRRVAQVKEHMEESYTEKLNLDLLAESAFLSKYHFTRTFKAIFKLSPYQYILRLRLRKAQELLGKGYSFHEISIITGFSDGKNLRKALNKIGVNRN